MIMPRMIVSLTEETMIDLKKCSSDTGAPKSWIVRKAVEEFFKQKVESRKERAEMIREDT